MNENNFFSELIQDFVKHELINDYIWYYESDLIFIDPYFVSFVDLNVVCNGEKESDILFINDFLKIFVTKYKLYINDRSDPNYSKLKYLNAHIQKYSRNYWSRFESKTFHNKYYCPYFIIFWTYLKHCTNDKIYTQIYMDALKSQDWEFLNLFQDIINTNDTLIATIEKYGNELKSIIAATKDTDLKRDCYLRHQTTLKNFFNLLRNIYKNEI